MSHDFVKTTIYDKLDDFDIVNYQFLNGDVPRSTSYGSTSLVVLFNILLVSFLLCLFVLYVVLALWPPVLQSSCPLCFSFVFCFRFCCL